MNNGKALFLPNLPDADYRAMEGLSYSYLKHFRGVTPEEGLVLASEVFTPTKETNLGNAFGELFEFGGIIMPVVPNGDGRTKEVKAARKDIGDRYITESGRDLVQRMYDKTLSHSVVASILNEKPLREISFQWTQGRRNTVCKGRSDVFVPERRINLDWKTTSESLSDHPLKKLIADRGYHLQQAWYRLGLRACGYEVDHCLLVFVRTVEPIQVRVVRLEDVDVQAGEDTMLELMEMYALCSEVGIWPGYGEEIDSLLLPDWVRK